MNQAVPGGIDPSDIRWQLQRIQLSSRFVSGPRIANFIEYVVEETLEGRADRIKQFTVAVDGLGEPEDFDPITNPAVRILARRVRRALHEYYANEGAKDRIRIDLPKGAYVPSFSDRKQDKPPKSNAVRPGATAEEAKIAVLPFSTADDDRGREQLARGFTIDLTSSLTMFSGIEVVGRHSAEYCASAESPVSQLRRDLGVEFVIAGAIMAASDTIQVSTELIDCETHEVIWTSSNDIDTSTDTPFEIINQFTTQIAATIGDYHGVIPRRAAMSVRRLSTGDVSAYQATLLFHDYLANYSQKCYQRARLAIENAVEKQPSYALGWAQLAELHCDAYTSWNDDSGWPEAALICANRSLAINPQSQEAWNVMAYIHLLSREHEDAIAEAEFSIKINPNAAFEVAWAAWIIGLGGEVERGMQLIDDMERLNPHQPGWLRGVAYIYHQERGEFQQCLHEARRIGMQDHPIGPLMQASAAGHLGNIAVARAALQSLAEHFPESFASPADTLSIWFHPEQWLTTLTAGIDKAKRLAAE